MINNELTQVLGMVKIVSFDYSYSPTEYYFRGLHVFNWPLFIGGFIGALCSYFFNDKSLLNCLDDFLIDWIWW